MIQRRILLAMAAAAALGGCAATMPAAAVAGQLVDVQIVDRTRHEVIPEYRHRGIPYVAGKPGDRYAVRLSNRSGSRVLVVLSVDGINAVSGETAGTQQTGYVLQPWQSADITGWRKSDAEAAAFYFTALADSYAARTDRPRNVGVIGAAVFRERTVPPRPLVHEPTPYPGSRNESGARQQNERAADDAGASAKATERSDSAPAPVAAAPSGERDAAPPPSRRERIGTGHGEREYSPITRTAFERATTTPAEVVQVRYDSYANLVAGGIIVPRRSVPDPFPGYVPDPRS